MKPIKFWLDPAITAVQYYQKFLINSHNKTSSTGVLLNQKIADADLFIANFFGCHKNETTFVPNEVIAKTICLQLLNLEQQGTIFYWGEDGAFFEQNIFTTQLKKMNFHELITSDWDLTIFEKEKNTNNNLLWINHTTELSLFEIQTLILKAKKILVNLKIFINISFLLYEDFQTMVKLVDGFIFNPFNSLKILGSVVIGIKQNVHSSIAPIAFGGGMSFLQNHEFVANAYPFSLAAGTQNNIQNLILADLLMLYQNNFQQIQTNLKNQLANFSSGNWSPTKNKFVLKNKKTNLVFSLNFNQLEN
ncbi:hypothetical protein J2Z62_000700 [Mycoplasmoides fastidiosum]|uniref:Uncharacterized protein n=1 Tax=Mycoplasmoides fastidiosum TaxID=92758 RepID=A0ABU0LZZ9_9BACT|nr:hypothetical protein [Mycoplasmoides fastidiosum]MDQ0514262.1 hypothetical protein [Mycoplasmoides fastidiosum]UUD37330.1 hypothetical protein NPA10_01975 [Mycoplasmoides fastidiosum]